MMKLKKILRISYLMEGTEKPVHKMLIMDLQKMTMSRKEQYVVVAAVVDLTLDVVVDVDTMADVVVEDEYDVVVLDVLHVFPAHMNVKGPGNIVGGGSDSGEVAVGWGLYLIEVSN